MGRADGFQALLDRAAANTIVTSPSPPLPVDRIFRAAAVADHRKENLGRNQAPPCFVVGGAGGGLSGDAADTSSFGAPGHDAPGQWSDDRRKLGRTTRGDSFDWNDETARNRGRPTTASMLMIAPPAPPPPSASSRRRQAATESPVSTTSRTSSSYSRNTSQQSQYPSESLHLRFSDKDERFHSPRPLHDQGTAITNQRSFQEFVRSRAEYDVSRHQEEALNRHRLDQPQRAHAQQQHQYVMTEAQWKLREAELEVAQQRKEREFQAQIEQFEQYRQEEIHKLDAEYRALRGMQQDVDTRISMLREVETELHEREQTLGDEQKATGEAITDLENQAERWEQQKQQRVQELVRLETQTRDEQRKLSRLQKQVETTRRESQDQQSALQDELRTIQSEITAADSERQTVESQLRSVHKTLESVQARVEQTQRELDAKTQRVNEADQKLTVVIGQLEVAQRQQRAMENDMVSTQQRHAQLKSEVSDMERHLCTEEERWGRTEQELNEARDKLETERREFRNQMNQELDKHHQALSEERRKSDEQIAHERQLHGERLAKERDAARASLQEQEQILETAKRRHAEQSTNFQERRRRLEKAFQEEHQKLCQERKALESERDQLRLGTQTLELKNCETEEKFSAALSEERRQTNKLRQELESYSEETKRLRHDLAQAQQKAMSNQQRLKEYSTRLEKQAIILENKSTTIQKDRERLEHEIEHRTQEMSRKEAVFREEQQKYVVNALLRHQADKRASLKAAFAKWAAVIKHKGLEEKLQQYERREYRLKLDYQSRLRDSHDKEKELYEEIEALKANAANLRERERIVMQGNDRIRQLATKLQEKETELRAREADLMGRWMRSHEQDDETTIGGSSISSSPEVS